MGTLFYINMFYLHIDSFISLGAFFLQHISCLRYHTVKYMLILLSVLT